MKIYSVSPISMICPGISYPLYFVVIYESDYNRIKEKNRYLLDKNIGNSLLLSNTKQNIGGRLILEYFILVKMYKKFNFHSFYLFRFY